MQKDYYRTLGVPRNATLEQIRHAYRILARQFHPDLNRTAGAENIFKSVGEAYDTLKDPAKRAEYDQDLQDQARRAADAAKSRAKNKSGFHGSGHHHPRAAKMGEHGWSHPHPRPNPFQHGNIHYSGDLEVPLVLDLEDAFEGGLRQIEMDAPELGGKRLLKVMIPRGVEAGRRIRLRGEGLPSSSFLGKRGDLTLVVELAPHPRFRLEGRNLVTTLTLAPWEAALGGKIPLETLNGRVVVQIPTGSSSGRRVLLRGKGMPGDGAHLDGDLLVEIKIAVPKNLSPDEEALFRKLANRSNFDPRR